ncbi:MATE family efflux transporter [Clostridium estertheticum]|uniref:Multidrug export protein MepA n=1 Tax=Clostridium estertheticum TaxID=238834 RepID=A0A5N7IJN3_9CLOT|nr:MATE family efflux transporter [Clostridium estertheticum]MPQ30514.1 MATE family efflux transporter [Clostridium estertheticum]MPQ61190.1 MATE family efflux transporter [Clostridium estertheticum]
MEQNKDSYSYYFEDAPIPKAIVHMAVPMMLGMSINMLYSIIDAFFIGKLNNTAMMTAVTLALPFTTILMAIGNVFGTGGGTYISRLLGEKDLGDAKKISSVSFYLSLLSGFIFMLLAIPLLHPILQILGARGDTVSFTQSYIMVFIIGSPFVIANFTLEQIVRAEGASTISMNGMILSVIINVILDPILIFTCNLGIAGAALGTIIGNLGAVLYYVYYLRNKSETLTISLKTFKPTITICSNIFKIGITAFLLDGFLMVSSLLLNNFSARYGDYAVAGFGISLRLVQLSEFIGMGLYMGVVPLIAYAYTANNIKRMNKVINTTTTYILILTIFISLIIFIFRNPIYHLFSRDVNVINTGIYILMAMLISSLFAAITGIITAIFQAIGRAKEATIMSIAQGILLIPIMVSGNYIFGLHGLIWSMTVTEVLTCLLGLCLWIKFNRDTTKIDSDLDN